MRSRKLKTLNCKICDEQVKGVNEDTVAVTCWRCVSASLRSTVSESEEDSDKINS